MRERRSPAFLNRWTWALLAAAGTISVAITGCENEDPNSVAIRDASYQLDALSPRSAPAASSDYVADQCQQIITALRKVSSEGNATQKAAANGLIARAQFSVASPKSEHARIIQARTQGEIEIVRSLYDRLLMQRALETAANNYDPSSERSEISEEMAKVVDQVSNAQGAKTQVDAVVSALRANAATKRAESQKFRNAEADLRQKVLTTDNYDEAAKLMVKTQEARRSADALDVVASDLEAQAAQRAPESDEIERQIQRYQNQLSLLATSQKEVAARDQQSKQDANTAAADVSETQSLLAAALTKLAATHDSEMLAATDDAVSTLGQASSAASQARSVIRSARAVMGEAQQAIGDLQWSTAELSQSYRGLLETLAQTSPPLVGLGDLTAASNAAGQSSTDRLRLAAEALNAAADSISDQELSDKFRDRANSYSARVGDPVETPDNFGDPAPSEPADPAGEDITGGQAG